MPQMKSTLTTLLAFTAAAFSAFAQTTNKLELTANDQMKFSTKLIQANIGQTLEITLRNIGKLPKTSMAHNLVILKPGSPMLTIAAKCHQAKDKGYIAQDAETRSAIITHGKLLGPGESTTITFTPRTSGDYPFLCTFPGHCTEMNGIIRVP